MLLHEGLQTFLAGESLLGFRNIFGRNELMQYWEGPAVGWPMNVFPFHLSISYTPFYSEIPTDQKSVANLLPSYLASLSLIDELAFTCPHFPPSVLLSSPKERCESNAQQIWTEGSLTITGVPILRADLSKRVLPRRSQAIYAMRWLRFLDWTSELNLPQQKCV